MAHRSKQPLKKKVPFFMKKTPLFFIKKSNTKVS